MILTAARAALSRLFTPEFRGVLAKSIGLTILALVGLWFGLREVFDWLALPFIDAWLPDQTAWAGWVSTTAAILAGLVIALGLAVLIAPASAIMAGFFLDDVAELVERNDYPDDPPGVPMPVGRSIVLSVQFFCVVVIGNIAALFLLLVPGVNLVAFFLVNGYLLGREFFEFAAMRHRSEREAKQLRSRYRGTVFLAGLVVAGLLAAPLINLAAPFLAAAMMVHLHKAITRREEAAGRAVPGTVRHHVDNV